MTPEVVTAVLLGERVAARERARDAALDVVEAVRRRRPLLEVVVDPAHGCGALPPTSSSMSLAHPSTRTVHSRHRTDVAGVAHFDVDELILSQSDDDHHGEARPCANLRRWRQAEARRRRHGVATRPQSRRFDARTQSLIASHSELTVTGHPCSDLTDKLSGLAKNDRQRIREEALKARHW
jgi:hypothetical protein